MSEGSFNGIRWDILINLLDLPGVISIGLRLIEARLYLWRKLFSTAYCGLIVVVIIVDGRMWMVAKRWYLATSAYSI